MPARLALLVTSSSASQVILDEPGAEYLMGRGDALFRVEGKGNMVRMQTPMAGEHLWQAIQSGWHQDE